MSTEKSLLDVWREWELRTGKEDSTLQLYSDGSGTFEERELYGPIHNFYSLEELREWLTLGSPTLPCSAASADAEGTGA